MNKILISPSILSADFANLEKDVAKVEENGADWLHIDVMDGVFVPNITLGIPVVKAIRKNSKLIFDVHLMIQNPQKHIERFIIAGADIVSVHYEACKNDLEETINLIKKFKAKAGVAINPKTPAQSIENVLEKIDLVTIMSVEPGFAGQNFMPEVLTKIEYLKQKREEKELDFLIEVDGGINATTGKIAKEKGANVLVAGSYIYKNIDTKAAIESLR